jgi:hypothetical protein
MTHLPAGGGVAVEASVEHPAEDLEEFDPLGRREVVPAGRL